MSRFKSVERTHNKLDEAFKKRLRHHEEAPPQHVWENIENHLNAEREKIKYDHWYYAILAVLIPIIAASVIMKYDLTLLRGNIYHKLTSQLSWLYTDDPEFGLPQAHNTRPHTGNTSSNINHSINNNPATGHKNQLPDRKHKANGVNKPDKKYIPANTGHSGTYLNNDKNVASEKESMMKPAITEENNNIATQPITAAKGIALQNDIHEDDRLFRILTSNNAAHALTEKINHIKGFYIGAGSRINNSWFLLRKNELSRFADEDMQYTSDYNLAYSISSGYNVSKNFGVEAEVTLVRQQQSYLDRSNRKITVEGNMSLTYLQIPLMAKYKWARLSAVTQQPIVFNIMAGPVYSRLLHLEYTVINEKFDRKEISFAENELGIMVGLEYDIYISRNAYFSIGTRAGASTDIRSFPYIAPNQVKTLNLFIGVDASFNFHLKNGKNKTKNPSDI